MSGVECFFCKQRRKLVTLTAGTVVLYCEQCHTIVSLPVSPSPEEPNDG